MGPIKPSQNVREQAQQAEREITDRAAKAGPTRNDESLQQRGMPGGPTGGLRSVNAYGNWQMRVSHAQQMERKAERTAASRERISHGDRMKREQQPTQEASQERPSHAQRMERAAAQEGASRERTSHQERTEREGQRTTTETAVNRPSRSNEVER
jgi:hypothetical protein